MNKEQAALRIIELFDPEFKTKKDWSEPRTVTTWGTKTKLGLKNSIIRILEDSGAPTLPKIDDIEVSQ